MRRIAVDVVDSHCQVAILSSERMVCACGRRASFLAACLSSGIRCQASVADGPGVRHALGRGRYASLACTPAQYRRDRVNRGYSGRNSGLAHEKPAAEHWRVDRADPDSCAHPAGSARPAGDGHLLSVGLFAARFLPASIRGARGLRPRGSCTRDGLTNSRLRSSLGRGAFILPMTEREIEDDDGTPDWSVTAAVERCDLNSVGARSEAGISW